MLLLLPMWNVKTSIHSSLHGSKDTCTSCCSKQTNIQVTSECTWFTINILVTELITIDLWLTLINFIKLQLPQKLQEEETCYYQLLLCAREESSLIKVTQSLKRNFEFIIYSSPKKKKKKTEKFTSSNKVFFFLNCKIHQYRIEYNNKITYKTSYNLYSKVQLNLLTIFSNIQSYVYCSGVFFFFFF